MELPNHVPASFRDTAGYVFKYQNIIYRYIHPSYKLHYEYMQTQQLFQRLIEQQFIINFSETLEIKCNEPLYKIIKPQLIPTLSLPYQWSFDMLKDAALCTLNIALQCIQKNVILKDATPHNIQFLHCKPIHIDTLSFEQYDGKSAWVAYTQFCQQFLYPLVLMAYNGMELQPLLLAYPQGIPQAVTQKLLPAKARFSFANQLYIYITVSTSAQNKKTKPTIFSQKKMTHLFTHLRSYIQKLKCNYKTHWSTYYEHTILSQDYLQEKENKLIEITAAIKPTTVLDIGCNTGNMSIAIATHSNHITAIDNDVNCINTLYNRCKKNNISNILPLVVDTLYPTPAMGWMNTEHSAFIAQNKYHTILALGIIHHWLITHNITLPMIANLLNTLSTHYAIVEYIPITDPKATLLIEQKQNYRSYTQSEFEEAILNYFTIKEIITFNSCSRLLYNLQKK